MFKDLIKQKKQRITIEGTDPVKISDLLHSAIETYESYLDEECSGDFLLYSKWEKVLYFTLNLDVPDSKVHLFAEASDYVLLILITMDCATSGDTPGTEHLDALEEQYNTWNNYYNELLEV